MTSEITWVNISQMHLMRSLSHSNEISNQINFLNLMQNKEVSSQKLYYYLLV